MRISDWSSDVCSSDLLGGGAIGLLPQSGGLQHAAEDRIFQRPPGADGNTGQWIVRDGNRKPRLVAQLLIQAFQQRASAGQHNALIDNVSRSEEHTSELQSLMRISYAVFCLKKKKNNV